LIKKTIPVKRIDDFSEPAKASEKDETAGVEAHRRRRRGGSKGAFRGGKPHVSKGSRSSERQRKAPKR